MDIKYTVFWIGTQREIYGDDSYYVLGEWMGCFNSHEEAVEFIKTLNLTAHDTCTILTVYSGTDVD